MQVWCPPLHSWNCGGSGRRKWIHWENSKTRRIIKTMEENETNFVEIDWGNKLKRTQRESKESWIRRLERASSQEKSW